MTQFILAAVAVFSFGIGSALAQSLAHEAVPYRTSQQAARN